MSQLGNCSGGTDPEGYGPSRLAVRYESIMALRLDPQNPRLHSRKQVRQIANSIKSFGFNVPVLIDAEKSVIAGHGRVLAAKALGRTEVPVIAIEHLDAAQRRAFAIADNRLTENSTWDDRLLAEQLRELSILDLSFDLEATGFDIGEIDFRIESLGEKAEATDPVDQLPSLQERAVSRVGDLWQLGRHRVLCGNALERSGFAVLMEGKTANLVFADPPITFRLRAMSAGLVRFVIASFPWPQGR
jgi:ParB-like chromosome segregation protein Spo0J